MKRTDIKKILLVGAGPIVIGQGCEFDYSGVQAVKALKNEGYEVVLVNSNPATVMTDTAFASRTYIEPMTPEVLHEVIRRERPDAILPTLGGQTALNLAMELNRRGVLKRYNVKMLGASIESIAMAEDRESFKTAMKEIGLDIPRSGSAHSMPEAYAVAKTIGSWPLVIRPGFTLGGTGGGIARNREEFDVIARRGLAASLNSEILIEESLLGWKEFEMEVMRDISGNAVIVCSIENLDPMGVHTGDSITVAPAMTLTDREYQAMRDDSIAVLEKIGIATGGSNVQWAVDPKTGRRIIIEMNPRVSRSSALASKATGFPIAKIAALLAVGYTLDEIRNDITRKTPAVFEPALDYVVVKMPRFAFEKFPSADTALGTQMKSVGEVMAIGKTFKESFKKAMRALEVADPLKYHDVSSFDPWFRAEIEELEEFGKFISSNYSLDSIPGDLLLQAKSMGFGDAELARLLDAAQTAVMEKRKSLGIRPAYSAVDTCAGEFEAVTPYFYSTYGSSPEKRTPDAKKKIMILGGGPNRIGQGIEFDWCCCHAAYTLKEMGVETVMVNSNPETVSTDYDTSDRLYFEPLTFEDVLEVYEHEGCDGAIVQFGGQTPLNIAQRLKAAGVNVIGTSPDDIDLAEDRDFFKNLVDEVGIRQPPSGIASSSQEALAIAERIGYPVLVRPSFVLGGRGMAIVHTADKLLKYVDEATEASEGKPVLIDKFLEDAIELDIDCISDGSTTVVGAILEHIEAAGCHSGDAAAVTPPRSLTEETIEQVRYYASIFAKRLHVKGLMNLQLAVKDGELWMIEVNPRASRTVPFVSKATGVPLADYATRCMMGESLKSIGFTKEVIPPYVAVKEAVFPFAKFPGVDITLTPEMKSTGEVMAFDETMEGAYLKSQTAAGSPIPKGGGIFVSLRDEDKQGAIESVQALSRLGCEIWATRGTSTALWEHGIESRAVFRISKGRPNALDLLGQGKISWIVNTSESGAEAAADEIQLRSAAISRAILVTTTLSAFVKAAEGLSDGMLFDEISVCSLQEYQARIRK